MKKMQSKPALILLVVVAAVGMGIALLYHSQAGFRIAGHRMGESLSDFSKIEAKRYRIDLSDCEHIGYPGKRQFCDYLVQLRDNKHVPASFTYSSGGWFDDQFPMAENEDRLTAPGMPDIAESWEIKFTSGRLSEVEFGPPLNYINWIRQSYGTPEQSEHPPTQKERIHGIVLGQTDRESIWKLPVDSQDRVLIRLTEAVSQGTVRQSQMNILLCPPCSEGEPRPGERATVPIATPASSPIPLDEPTKEHVRAAVERPWDVPPELQKVLQHVFDADVATFQLGTNGPGELRIKGDEAFFSFCKAHDCPDHMSALVIDLSNGKAAGAIKNEGRLSIYQGDYPSRDAIPDSLRGWQKENGQP